MPDSDSWFEIARLLRPQGRKGELLADPLTDVPDCLVAGREVRLLLASAAPLPRLIESVWQPSGKNSGRVVLKLSGCNSITEAEALAGLLLAMPKHQQPQLEADMFFVGDLIGCKLLDSNRFAGKVVDVQHPTSPDGRTRLEDAATLLVILPKDEGDTVFVPFIKAWLDSVDLNAKTISMRLPPGLFEIEDGDQE